MMLEFTDYKNPDRKLYIDPKCIQVISPAPSATLSKFWCPDNGWR